MPLNTAFIAPLANVSTQIGAGCYVACASNFCHALFMWILRWRFIAVIKKNVLLDFGEFPEGSTIVKHSQSLFSNYVRAARSLMKTAHQFSAPGFRFCSKQSYCKIKTIHACIQYSLLIFYSILFYSLFSAGSIISVQPLFVRALLISIKR